jgi:hypothetical protein
VKAKQKEAFAQWQRSDAGKAWRKAFLARRKLAAVSGTTAEAISIEEAA